MQYKLFVQEKSRIDALQIFRVNLFDKALNRKGCPQEPQEYDTYFESRAKAGFDPTPKLGLRRGFKTTSKQV